MKLLLACLAACLPWIAAPSAAHALAVRQTLWGFDGQVVPGTFNPLSVLVVNLSPVPFDGQLELHPDTSIGARGGGTFVAPCYLAPGTSRWVQFYPFFHNDYNGNGSGWTLVWGDGPGGRFDFDAPTLAAPARVWFDDPGAVASSFEAARLKHFPDELFPPTVAAADGLDTVVLDHVPRWEPARRAAFLDWVHGGGALHLLPDAAGREPVFTDELAALNSPVDSLRIGSGHVIHHHGSPGDLRRDNALLANDPPAPTLAKGSQPSVYDLDDNLFGSLNRLTRPRVRWALLYGLTTLYLLAVGPGHYFWARRQRDYRLSLLALTGGVAVFALGFGYFGRRGFDEQGKVLTVACARALDGNRYDVTQRSNVFVTRGGVYTLTHPAEYNLYGSGTAGEGTAGLALSGRGGAFRVDMPLFSSAAVLHRGVMTGDDTTVVPTQWKMTASGDAFENFTLALPADFPGSRFQSAWVRYRGKFHELRYVNHTLQCSGPGMKADDFLGSDALQATNTYAYSYAKEQPPMATVLASWRRVLIAESLGGNDHFPHYVSRPPPPDDEAELFLFVNDSPETFRLSGNGNPAEPSLVMYRRTVFQPPAP